MTPGPKGDAFDAIGHYVVDCTTDLLAAYRHQVDLVEDGLTQAPGLEAMATIGFTTPDMRGSLVLMATREVVQDLVPEELWRAPLALDQLLRDVLGEFANMLAGRIRNRLLAHGVEAFVTTPTTELGAGLVAPGAADATSTWYRFEGQGIDLFVRLELAFDEAFTLPAFDEAQAPSMHEGDLVFL